MSRDPVETFTRHATSVDTLPEAWEFVMEMVDVAGPEPAIEIKPFWVYSESEDGTRRFSVVVSWTDADA